MPVSSYELMTIAGEYIAADLVVWRRYRVRAFGIVERLLDDNPHLAKLHRYGPFLPVGTQLRIPIDLELLANQPQAKNQVVIYGEVPGISPPRRV